MKQTNQSADWKFKNYLVRVGCSCTKMIKKVVAASSIDNLVINISNIHDIEDVVSKILLKTNQAFNDDKTTHSTFQAALHMIPWRIQLSMISSKIPIHDNSCSNKNKNIVKKDLQQMAMTMLLATETNSQEKDQQIPRQCCLQQKQTVNRRSTTTYLHDPSDDVKCHIVPCMSKMWRIIDSRSANVPGDCNT